MAHVTSREFDTIIRLLTEHYGLNVLHERLLKANALVSRKRPPRWQPLANQLYQLSAGLRREHPARYAIELLWQDLIASHTEDEQQEAFDALAERINECLTGKFEIILDKQSDLTSALGAYQQALTAISSEDAAYIEILLRASNSVAQFLREHKDEVLAAVPEEGASGETSSDEQDNQAGQEKADSE